MPKAKITWKGEPDGPDETTWRHVTFKKGEAVEVDDPQVILKAKTNPNYSVEFLAEDNGDVGKEDPKIVPAPSAMGAQYPVPKPGEPITPKEPPSTVEKPPPVEPEPKAAEPKAAEPKHDPVVRKPHSPVSRR